MINSMSFHPEFIPLCWTPNNYAVLKSCATPKCHFDPAYCQPGGGSTKFTPFAWFAGRNSILDLRPLFTFETTIDFFVK